MADRYKILMSECFDDSYPNGWHSIVGRAVGRLDELRVEALPELRVHQIKQKLGGLRLYTSHDGDPRAYQIIVWAEVSCRLICERCGSGGTSRNLAGYLCVMCDECADAYLRRRR